MTGDTAVCHGHLRNRGEEEDKQCLGTKGTKIFNSGVHGLWEEKQPPLEKASGEAVSLR